MFKRSRQHINDLKNERKKYQPNSLPTQIYASFGIVGPAGTGRKTLGYRFGHLDEVVVEAVVARYSYVSVYSRDIYRGVQKRTSSVCLWGYIIDQPQELPERNPPFYAKEWNEFFCLLFVFDVSNSQSLVKTSEYLTTFRDSHGNLPVCYLVGNKDDLRDPSGRNNQEVARRNAVLEAEQLGTIYHECSARLNNNVEPLLVEIMDRAIEARY